MSGVTQITCADEMATLAREAIEQLWTTKRFGDLIGAVLMANHVADWHFKNDLGREFGCSEKAAMRAIYPEWDTLRQLANGMKHCRLQPTQQQIEWEHDDFWDSPGHVCHDGMDWFVDFDGKQRSVAILIITFLDKFADRSSRPQ